MSAASMKVRKKIDRDAFVIAERATDRIKLTAYFGTKPRREISTVTVLANDVPIDQYDALRFIHDRCWGGGLAVPARASDRRSLRSMR